MAKYILPPLPGYFVKFAAKTHLCFSPCCRFILLACDGLFKVFTPEEAVNFILSCLEVSTLRRSGCLLFRLPLGFREVLGPLPALSLCSPGPLPPVSPCSSRPPTSHVPRGEWDLHPGHSPLSFSHAPATGTGSSRPSWGGISGVVGRGVPVHQHPFPTL